jgi:hypothetical protein
VAGILPFEMLPGYVDTYSKEIQVGADKATQLIADAGIDAIVDNTPVDTSLLVSNWQAGIGAPKTGTIAPLVAGSIKGSGAGSARGLAKSIAHGVIASQSRGRSIYITNNIEYAGVNEYGDEKHRPAGMVSKGLQAMRLRASSITLMKS